jgi:hypothetical protein
VSSGHRLIFFVFAAVVLVLAVIEPRVPAVQRLRINLVALALLSIVGLYVLIYFKDAFQIYHLI